MGDVEASAVTWRYWLAATGMIGHHDMLQHNKAASVALLSKAIEAVTEYCDLSRHTVSKRLGRAGSWKVEGLLSKSDESEGRLLSILRAAKWSLQSLTQSSCRRCQRLCRPR